jgi:hypothetical protein
MADHGPTNKDLAQAIGNVISILVGVALVSLAGAGALYGLKVLAQAVRAVFG